MTHHWRRFSPSLDRLESRLMPAPFLKPLGAGTTTREILTTTQTVARSSQAAQLYRMVGNPDGLGAFDAGDGTLRLLMNHEFGQGTTTQPIVGGATVTGSFVSEFVISKATGAVLSGDLALTRIVRGTDSTPLSGSFGSLCSAFLADARFGFDRPIYFTGEESGGAGTFDGKGGQAIAIFDGTAHILPELGHFAKENVIAIPNTGSRTVLLATEDAGSLTSQLYLYVGQKDPASNDPLIRNGLVGGKLYVLTLAGRDESNFHKNDSAISPTWTEVTTPAARDAANLESFAQAAGSFDFVRVEDAAVDPTDPTVVYFITTGLPGNVNSLGRLYRLRIDPNDPAGGQVLLSVVLEGDRGDGFVNPDNIDINAQGQILICEDPNGDHRGNYLDQLGRDTSVFLYDPGLARLVRVAQVDRSAAPANERGIAGDWETTGVIDAGAWFGSGSWLINVMAHTMNPGNATVGGQGGQILLINTAGALRPRIATAVDTGGGPHVRVMDGAGNELFGFFAFSPGFRGGVRTALGDVTGDGIPDVVVAAGPGGGPHVRVIDGRTRAPVAGTLGSFFAYASGFRGGVFVASADVNGDGFAEVVTAAGAGGGPHVRVFDGQSGNEIRGWMAYSSAFTGGLSIAADDVNGDGNAEVITGAGPGGGPHVRVFNATTGSEIFGFFAYAMTFNGGVTVAAGDANGDGRADILTGAGSGGGPHVRLFDGVTRNEIAGFFAFDVAFLGGVRVAMADVTGDGLSDLIAATGAGIPSRIALLDGPSRIALRQISPFDAGFLGGVYVGGR